MFAVYSDYIKRKDNILITAIDLLDEVGIQGMTTKEIAKRQKISEPAIYRQFSGKRDIILTMLECFSNFDLSIYNTIIENRLDCISGISYFLNAYAEYYENYPQISTIMLSYDVFKYEKETNEKMKTILLKRREFVAGIIRDGQAAGSFSNEINCEDAAEIILGILWSLTYNWKLSDCSYSLKQKLDIAFEYGIKPFFSEEHIDKKALKTSPGGYYEDTNSRR